MDEKVTSIDKSKKVERNKDELTQEINQNPKTTDVSIFDETLKEIDQILNNLEEKSKTNRGQLEKLDVLPEIKTVISKINLAKNELTKEENNLIKDNNLLSRVEDLEKNYNNKNKSILLSKDFEKNINEVTEHEIDRNLLSTDELNYYSESEKNKIKKSFGFYSYLILIIVIFFVFYGALEVLKDLIILKYPTTEIYIGYFYEIIEFIKITIINLFEFSKNEIF
jgi:hypothetical protein